MYCALQLMDTRNFSIFYGFVFFMCRELGQKSICKLTFATLFLPKDLHAHLNRNSNSITRAKYWKHDLKDNKEE